MIAAPRTLGGGLLASLALAGAGCAPAVEEPPRDLVVISLDTVRRDHLPTYGYERPTAPAVDALARRSVVFDRAFAQDTNTVPSHATIFTGLYPHVHGGRSNQQPLPDGRATLTTVLRAAGFRTAAFVSGLTMRHRVSGLKRGFEVYDDDFEGKRRDGRVASERAIAWLRERERDERAFLFVHLFDAHGRYEPRGAYRGMFVSDAPGPELERIPEYQRVIDEAGNEQRGLHGYVDRYDAMIRYADDLVAEILAAVDPSRALIVVVADHGETLGERYHALDHGAALFDEQVRIPLIVHVPGVAARRSDALVETVDLLPTLLELLEVERPRELPVQGRSLAPLIRGGEAPPRDHVFSSARAVARRHRDRGYKFDRQRRIHGVRSGRWKLVRYPGPEQDFVELYDLDADPQERENVAERFTDERDRLLEALDRWLGGAMPLDDPEIDPELLEQLRQLGYVG